MKLYARRMLCFLIFLFSLFTMSACGKTSRITIDQLQNELKSVDSDISLTKEKTHNGYSFSGKTEDYFVSISYLGTADKNENVTSITITNKNVDTEILQDYSSIPETIYRCIKSDGGDIRTNEFAPLSCWQELMSIESLINPDYGKLSIEDTFALTYSAFQGNDIIHDNWTVSAQIDQLNETVIIKAEYAK